jgi:hypothetical protein
MCCLGSGLCDTLITRAEGPYCVCVFSRNTVRFKCERVFQTGTSFLGKDVFLVDGKLIFISWCFFQEDVRPVVSIIKISSE